MSPKARPEGDDQPLLSEDSESTADGEVAALPRGLQPRHSSRSLGRGSAGSRLRNSSLSRHSAYELVKPLFLYFECALDTNKLKLRAARHLP